MSSILKALEKVEQSQTGRRSAGPAGLARSGKRRAAWILPAGIMGGAAVAALVTFAAMGGFSRHPAPSQQAMAGNVPTPAPVAVIPAATVPPASAPQTAPVAKAVAAPAAAAKVNAAPAAPAKSAPSALASSVQEKAAQGKPVSAVAPQHATAASSDHGKSASAKSASRDHDGSARAKSNHEWRAKNDGESGRRREAISRQQAEKNSVASPSAPSPGAAPNAAPAPVTAAQAPAEKAPELRVTGIAWQKDSHSSAAIINGRPVQQGGMVEGYKVEQIFEDKVRFSGKGGHLEVPLGGGE